ncbi:cysteine proteinase [Ascodesmis nigricans]|uniref:Cysteine proteinase n=1 Tax=Ascodesmis nigricans TaxID=341454 RepID=A0A4S2MSU9_9PEZI|nr:cysteine proteinase [Ascodesmis nigricans]
MAKRKPELAKKTHFFNTYFYERLSSKGDEETRLKAVLKWTNKIDIFSKDYIIIPINESSHWYLALVCNLCHLKRRLKSKDAQVAEDTAAESDATIANETAPSRAKSEPTSSDNDTTALDSQLQVVSLSDDEPEWPEEETAPSNPELEEKNRTFRLTQNGLIEKPADKKKRERVYDPPDTPCIIILDSMGSGGTVRHGGALKHIRTWLTAEASQKRCLQLSKDHIKNIYGKAPNQTNWYDCGLFVLHYVERFIDETESFVTGFLKGRTVDQTLWDEESIHDKRLYLFNLINKLHDEFVEFEKKQKQSVIAPTTATAELKPTSPPDTTTPIPPVQTSLPVCNGIEDIHKVVHAGSSTSQPAELSHRQSPEFSSDTTSPSTTSDAPNLDAKNINGMGIYDSVYPPSSTTTIPDTPPPEDQTTISSNGSEDDLEQVDQVPVPQTPPSLSVTRSQSKREPSLSSAWGLVATSAVSKTTLQSVPQPASPIVKFNEEEHVRDEEVDSSNCAASKRRLKKRLSSMDKDEDDDVVMIETPQKKAKIMEIPESQEL